MRATRHPSVTSSSSSSVRSPASRAVTRIETKDGSSLVRPILKSSTSNAPSWRTTVSNIALSSCESIRWPSASTISVAAGTSVGERVQHDVHADGVAVRREAIEVLLVLPLALPAVGDVGVVRHADHQAPFLVVDAAEVHAGSLRAPLRDPAPAAPELNRRHLLDLLHDVPSLHDRMNEWDVYV